MDRGCILDLTCSVVRRICSLSHDNAAVSDLRRTGIEYADAELFAEGWGGEERRMKYIKDEQMDDPRPRVIREAMVFLGERRFQGKLVN